MLLENGKVAAIGPVREVMNRYLTSQAGQLGERLWPDPRLATGDGVARMRAVRAIDSERKVVNQVRVTDAFELELEFEVLEAGHRIDVGFYLYDASGSIVFVVQDNQSSSWRDKPRPAGVHRSRCRVPPHLLNEGRISVLAALATPPTTVHGIERDAICIDVLDDMDSTRGARGDYTREWPGGAVRPLLEWSFEQLSGENSR
jgi:lipopolysaccharide transport system ATP-binding protein